MFDLLNHTRQSLAFHTELLEACDWDEKYMEHVIKVASSVFENARIPDIPCPFDHYINMSIRPALLREKLQENQIKVIINFVIHNSNFVKWMLSAPEE